MIALYGIDHEGYLTTWLQMTTYTLDLVCERLDYILLEQIYNYTILDHTVNKIDSDSDYYSL